MLRSLAVLAVVAVATPGAAQAQDAAFGKGTKILSLGVMTGGDYEGIGGGASFEIGLRELTPKMTLGIGGMIGYVRDSESAAGFDYSLNQMPIMAIANLHFDVANQPKLDLYAGASAGIIRVSLGGDFDDVPGLDASDSDTGFGIQGGVRYSMNAKTSLMGQVGIGDIPLVYAGLSFKF